MVKLATAAPEGVNRSSGSAVRFPITVITVSPAMTLLKPRSARVGSDQLGADDGLVQAELTIELLCQLRRGVHVHHGVDAFGALVDVVGEPTPTPYVRLVHGPSTCGDDPQELLERGRHRALVDRGVEDDHHFVMTHT